MNYSLNLKEIFRLYFIYETSVFKQNALTKAIQSLEDELYERISDDALQEFRGSEKNIPYQSGLPTALTKPNRSSSLKEVFKTLVWNKFEKTYKELIPLRIIYILPGINALSNDREITAALRILLAHLSPEFSCEIWRKNKAYFECHVSIDQNLMTHIRGEQQVSE